MICDRPAENIASGSMRWNVMIREQNVRSIAEIENYLWSRDQMLELPNDDCHFRVYGLLDVRSKEVDEEWMEFT